MKDINFWHINEYEVTKNGEEKSNSYITYGDWNYIEKILNKKNINFSIVAINASDFKNFKSLMEFSKGN